MKPWKHYQRNLERIFWRNLRYNSWRNPEVILEIIECIYNWKSSSHIDFISSTFLHKLQASQTFLTSNKDRNVVTRKLQFAIHFSCIRQPSELNQFPREAWKEFLKERASDGIPEEIRVGILGGSPERNPRRIYGRNPLRSCCRNSRNRLWRSPRRS